MKKILCLIVFVILTTFTLSAEKIHDIFSLGLMMNSYTEEDEGLTAKAFGIGFGFNGTIVWKNGFTLMIPGSIEFFDSVDYDYGSYTQTVSGINGTLFHFPLLLGFSPIRTDKMVLSIGAGPHLDFGVIDMDYVSSVGTYFGLSALAQFNYFFTEKIGAYASLKYSRDFRGSTTVETPYSSETVSGSVTLHHFMPSFGISVEF